MVSKKKIVWIVSIILATDVLMAIGFYLVKKKANSQKHPVSVNPEIVLPDGTMTSESSPSTVKVSDPRFQQSIDMRELSYPLKSQPFEILGCDDDLESPFEDPYKFVDGLGFSREVLLPDQGDLQNLSVYLKINQTPLPDTKSLESSTSLHELKERNSRVENAEEVRKEQFKEEKRREQNTSEDKTSDNKTNEETTHRRGTSHSSTDQRQVEAIQNPNINEISSDGGLEKSTLDSGNNPPAELDPNRPFLKLEMSHEISETGKFRIRAFNYLKENLQGSSQEMELHPDSSVLLNKGEALKVFKKEIFNFVRAGAQIGSRIAIISQEYQSAGANGLITVEFLNADIARMTAPGVTCQNNHSLLSCRCTSPKGIP